MELDIFSQGKEYISASRAAKKTGYASDYIGQLCRSGKIPGKLVGRTWYVDLESLLTHKRTRQLGKPRRVPVIASPAIKQIPVLKIQEHPVEILPPVSAPDLKIEYVPDASPLLPLIAKRIPHASTGHVSRFVPAQPYLVVAFAMVIVITGALSLLRAPQNLAMRGENLALQASAAEATAISFFGALSQSAEFVVDGIRNLQRIAFGTKNDAPGKSPNLFTSKVQIATTTATPPGASALTAQTPALDTASLKSSLQTELEAYVRTQLSALASPRLVYSSSAPTVNTVVLREEILATDTRPTVTRQSSSDVNHFSSALADLADTGVFTNPTIIGGTITGASFSGTGGFSSLVFDIASGTSATTTSFFATTASSTNLFSSLASFVAASSTTFAITGDGAGLAFYGSGNHDITAAGGTLRIGANTIIGNILPLDSTISIGAAGTRFNKIYADEVNANTVVGTISGGNVSAESMRINSDNATADTEDSFIEFERGSLTPNALITWDSTNKRFTMNAPLALNGGIGNGNLLATGSTTLQNFTFVNATGTAATTTSLAISYAATADRNAFSIINENTASSGFNRDLYMGSDGAGSFISNGAFNGSTYKEYIYFFHRTNETGARSITYSAGTDHNFAVNDNANTILSLSKDNGITAIAGRALTYSNGTSSYNVFSVTPTINTTGGTNTIRGIYYNPTLTSTTGTTNIAFQNTTGNVLLNSVSGSSGVGTTTPWAKFSVGAHNQSLTTPLFAVASSSDAVATTTHFIVTGAGNVGIGTANPTFLLHARKDQAGSTAIVAENATDGVGSEAVVGARNAAGAVSTLGMTSASYGTYGAITGNNAYWYSNGPLVLMADHATLGVIKFTAGGNSEKARIDTAGNLGLGTTTPWGRLSVGAANMSLSTPLFVVASSSSAVATTTKFIVTGAGNVGIGTAAPVSLLDLKSSDSDVRQYLHNSVTGSGGSDGLLFQIDSASRAYIWNYENASLNFGTNNSQRLTIDENGFITHTMTENTPVSSTTFFNNTWGGSWVRNTSNTTGTVAGIGFTNGNALNAVSGIGGIEESTTLAALGFFTGGSGLSNTVPERMRITSAGNVGIGTTTPSHQLTIASSTGPQLTLTDGLASSNPFTFRQAGSNLYIATSSQTTFATSTVPALTILGASGNVGIGTTSPATLLEIGGGTANVTFGGYKNCTGFTSNDNGFLACTASDKRLKEGVTALPSTQGLAAINALNPVSFHWKSETERGPEEQYGLIAQEVRDVFPNLVTVSNATELTPDGTLSVNYDGFVAPFILALQEISRITGVFKDSLVAWLGDAANGVQDFFARRVHTQELCVGDGSGETCITKDQLDQLLAGAGMSGTQTGGGSGGSEGGGTDMSDLEIISPDDGGDASSTPDIIEDPQPEPDPEPEPEPETTPEPPAPEPEP